MDRNFLVDSHCHLDYPELSTDLDTTLKRADNAGVGHFLTISVDLEKTDKIIQIAESSDKIHATAGIHPHEAGPTIEKYGLDSVENKLNVLAEHPKIVGLGETGLDYYYLNSPKDAQIALFKSHIKTALMHDLPIIVHTRDAEEDTIRILKEEGQGKLRGLIHCFSGTQYLADEALNMGFYISVSGIITFPKAQEIRDVIKTVPMDRLLVETDAPYLAPVPHRGKPNEPSFVVHTAKTLAEIKGLSNIEIASQTTKNFFNLFNKISID